MMIVSRSEATWAVIICAGTPLSTNVPMQRGHQGALPSATIRRARRGVRPDTLLEIAGRMATLHAAGGTHRAPFAGKPSSSTRDLQQAIALVAVARCSASTHRISQAHTIQHSTAQDMPVPGQRPGAAGLAAGGRVGAVQPHRAAHDMLQG